MISKSERRAYPKNLDTTALDIWFCFTSLFFPKIFTWLFHHALSNVFLINIYVTIQLSNPWRSPSRRKVNKKLTINLTQWSIFLNLILESKITPHIKCTRNQMPWANQRELWDFDANPQTFISTWDTSSYSE